MHSSSQGSSAGSATRHQRRPARFTGWLTAVLCGLALPLIGGCASFPFSSSPLSSPLHTTSLRGNVQGGQQPIANATIQLYAAGQTGVASAATPLLPATLTTGSDGGFSLSGRYSCPSAASPVYLVARGGNPGLFTGANTSIALMAALGTCAELEQLNSVTLNEVTTVGAVFSLAAFMTSPTQVGTDPTLTSQFADAWSQTSQLVNVQSGVAPGPNAASLATAVPVAKINSIANLLATCINSAGGSAGDSSMCGQLFAYTTANGDTPADTVDVVLQIARNPALQTRNLFALLGPLVPFEPKLATTPTDWGLLSPSGIALATPLPVVTPPVVVPPVVVPPVVVPPVIVPPVVVPPVVVPPVVTPPTPPLTPPASGVFWYIRADGGTPAQCTGHGDAAYGGSGTARDCAFGDWRYLYDSNAASSYGHLAWVIAGGDTVIVDNTKPWRVGWSTATGAGEPWCVGGDNRNCFNPAIPAGTAAQHTRILGRNFAACSTADGQPDKSKMTQLYGGHGALNALNLRDTSWVDVQCLEITQHSTCQARGNPVMDHACTNSPSAGTPVDDWDSNGIVLNSGAFDILLQDVYTHGHINAGIIGPMGGNLTMTRVTIAFNPAGGWNIDDNSGNYTTTGVARLNYVSIIGSGCLEEHPAVHAFPALKCYDQAAGGYGDGIGSPNNDYGADFYIDHSTFAYNTEDAYDFGHVNVGNHTLSVTNSLSYGNEGAAAKWGKSFSTEIFENNVVVADCTRMGTAVPGSRPGFNSALGGNWCRSGAGMSFAFQDNSTITMVNNVIVSEANGQVMAPQCQESTAVCNNATFIFKNNLVRGYFSSVFHAAYPSNGIPGNQELWDQYGSTFGHYVGQNNSYFGVASNAGGTNCVAGALRGTVSNTVSGENCNDPHWMREPASAGDNAPVDGEAAFDGLSFRLASGSSAIGSGVTVPGLITDRAGAPWAIPPSRGAFEYAALTGTATSLTVPGSSVTFGTTFPLGGSVSPAATGTLVFSTAGGTLGQCTLNSSACSINTSLPYGATYSIRVDYLGDASHDISFAIGTYTTTTGVASVALAPSATQTLSLGSTLNFTALATTADGAPSASVTPSATWNSSNVSAGTISSSGVLTAAAVGTTAITATYGGVTSSPVTVNVIPASTVNFDGAGVGSSGSGTSVSATLNVPTDGDAVLIDVQAYGGTDGANLVDSTGATVTLLPGYPALYDSASGGGHKWLYLITNASAGSHTLTWSVASSDNYLGLVAYAFSGASTTSPLMTSNVVTGSGSSVTGGNVAVTRANTLLVGFATTTSGISFAAGTGSIPSQPRSDDSFVSYGVAPGAGTQFLAGSFGAGTAYSFATVALQP